MLETLFLLRYIVRERLYQSLASDLLFRVVDELVDLFVVEEFVEGPNEAIGVLVHTPFMDSFEFAIFLDFDDGMHLFRHSLSLESIHSYERGSILVTVHRRPL